MAVVEQLQIIHSGVNVWKQYREKYKHLEVDLFEADLGGYDLTGIDLTYANLANANLTKSNLCRADLTGANLSGATLRDANLSEAILEFTNLYGADLRNVNLHNANLSKASLYGADLRETIFHDTNLYNTDFNLSTIGFTIFINIYLNQALNTESVTHYSNSSIDTKTIKNSKGRIPISFLRGCGLSDSIIEFTKLENPAIEPEEITDIIYKVHNYLVNVGVEYYSCFIAYSHKDEEFAKKLYNDLQDNGVRCWFATENMKIGDKIRSTIDRQIRLRDKLLVILSENSIASEWVGDEVEAALEEERKNHKRILFPIHIDNITTTAYTDWAAKIKRQTHIGNFSNWHTKSNYLRSFERLLRDLRTNG